MGHFAMLSGASGYLSLIHISGEEWVVWTAAGDLMAVSKGIEAQGIEVKGAELTMVPTTPTAVSGADARRSSASSTASRTWTTSRTCTPPWT